MTESVHRLTDERLCWLAVRGYCEQQSRQRGVLGWLALLSGRNRSIGAMARDDQRHAMSDKLGTYAFAVDDAARTLSPDERRHLRATGEVPDWFLTDVERRFQDLSG